MQVLSAVRISELKGLEGRIDVGCVGENGADFAGGGFWADCNDFLQKSIAFEAGSTVKWRLNRLGDGGRDAGRTTGF